VSVGKALQVTLLDLLLAVLVACACMFVYAWTVAPTLGIGLSRVAEALVHQRTGWWNRTDGPWRYELILECTGVPDDDRALIDWLREQPGLSQVGVHRQEALGRGEGPRQRVTAYFFAPAEAARPAIPWAKLGYSAGEGEPQPGWARLSPGMAYNASDDQLVLLCLGALQVGLLLVGLVRIARNRKLPEPEPRERRALFAGLGVGLLLAGLYWAADQALSHFWGPTQALSRSWLALPSADWNVARGHLPPVWRDVQPPVLLLGALAAMVVLFPLAQTVFFCSHFALWSAAGRPRTAAVLGAVVPAVLILDWHFMPAALLLAVPLVWVFLWSRSLLAPLLALVLLCLGIAGTTFGVFPGLPHPTNQIVGRWAPVEGWRRLAHDVLIDPSEDVPLEFLRGIGMRGGKTLDKDGDVFVLHAPMTYHWTDAGHIEMTFHKETNDRKQRVITAEVEVEDYEVTVAGRELTLTRTRDGKVFRYRRLD
jgi:hypothetical protein